MRSWRISHRILLVSIVPALFLYLIVATYFVNFQFHAINLQLNERGQLLAQQLANTLQYGVETNNKEILNSILAPVVKEADVIEVEIVNQGGVPIVKQRNANYTKPSLEQRVVFKAGIYQDQKLGIQTRPSRSFQPVVANESKGIQWTLYNPSRKSNTPIGEVIVILNDSRQHDQEKRLIIITGLLAVIGILLAMSLAWLLSQSITQSVQQLRSVVKEITESNFDIDIPKQAPEELALLSTQIALMADQLANKEQREKAQLQRLNQSRQIAESSNRAKSEFLANMSHELRAPLDGTLGLLKLLQDSHLTQEQQEYLFAAHDSTEHLLDIINDILDFSKIEEGQLELENIYFDAKQVIKRCANAFIYTAKRRRLNLTTDFIGDKQDVEIKCDPTRFRQILINLISNALKFTHRGGVEITTSWIEKSQSQLDLVVSVEDSGIGIPKDKIPNIFRAFTQLDESLPKRHHSSGLGLAITNQLVNLMDGDIEIYSEEGVGSRFTITLTVDYRIAPYDDQHDKQEHFNFPSLSGHILLVEDNSINQLVITTLLKKMGLSFECAEDGVIALQYFHDKTYDLILMDCQMPNLDGIATTGRIRELEVDKETKTVIIGLSPNADQKTEADYLDLGFDGLISKPIDKWALSKELAKYLATKT